MKKEAHREIMMSLGQIIKAEPLIKIFMKASLIFVMRLEKCQMKNFKSLSS